MPRAEYDILPGTPLYTLYRSLVLLSKFQKIEMTGTEVAVVAEVKKKTFLLKENLSHKVNIYFRDIEKTLCFTSQTLVSFVAISTGK
jgi:hypothetical protein